MSYKDKEVVVTGGAGFVGSNLVMRLVKEGARVSVIDNLSTGSEKNLDGIWKDISFFHCTIDDYDKYAQYFEDAEVVFHLAARNIITSIREPHVDFYTNIGGTLNVLSAARVYRVGRVVYASSASVYGNPKYLPINEDDQVNLLTPYAVSKFAGEGYCMAFYESYELPTVVLRLSNVYGPFQRPENPYCGVVAKFMQSVKEGKPMQIHGSGQQTRDFTYVDDVVDAFMIAGENPRAVGEVFNIASGEETSVSKLAETIMPYYSPEAFAYKTSDQIFEYIDRRDIDNISRRVLNIEKARKKLGWSPKTVLWKGIMNTWQWMENN